MTRAEQDAVIARGNWQCIDCHVVRRTTDIGIPKSGRTKDMRRKSELRILQWNCRGLRTKMAELPDLLSAKEVDVAVLQETKLKPGDKCPRFDGYTIIRNDRTPTEDGVYSQGGGLLTIIKNDVPFGKVVLHKTNPDNVEMISVTILNHRSLPLTIHNVYRPPVRSIPGETRSNSVNWSSLPSGRGQAICGDFNAHDHLWDDNYVDAAGELLVNWCMDHSMVTLNSGAGTRLNPSSGKTSCPDVCIADTETAKRSSWEPLEYLGSDHKAILVTINSDFTSIVDHDRRQLRYCWKRARWPEFTNMIEQALAAAQNSSKLDVNLRIMNEAVCKSAKLHIGLERKGKKNRSLMTAQIKQLCSVRNQLGHQVPRDKHAWVTACKAVVSAVDEERERRWKEFLGELNLQSDPTKAWGTIRALDGQFRPNRNNSALVVGGKTHITPASKASAFVKRYAAVSRLKMSRNDRIVNRELKKRMKACGSFSEESVPFSMSELELALKAMKARGAAGPDGIAPRFLKNLGPIARQWLLNILNESWTSGYCPQEWKSADIIPLLKSGKSPEDIGSFRPVSLTSCTVKVLERMIGGRLQHMAEARGWWCAEQAGFRRGRSCEDQIVRLSQDISDGFQSNPMRRTVLALLDYSKAYDTVWREKLLTQMLDTGVPPRFVKWLIGFFQNRRGSVVVDGVKGTSAHFKQGLPQGSVLAPCLFLFAINGLRDMVTQCNVSMYADDVAIWHTNFDRLKAAEAVSIDLAAIGEWSTAAKLQLNLDKCETAFFSNSTREAKWEPDVRIDGVQLKVNTTPKFLGVTFDRSLSFRPHINDVCTKVARRCRMLNAIASRSWGWSKKSLRAVYVSMIRSVITYSAPGWTPWISDSGLDQLTRADNRAIRMISGVLSTSPLEAIYIEADVPPLNKCLEMLCCRSWISAHHLPFNHPRNMALRTSTKHRIKKGSWRVRGQEIAVAHQLIVPPRPQAPLPGPEPWRTDHPTRWKVDLSLESMVLRDIHEDKKKEMAEDAISLARGQGQVLYFTDGSCTGGVENGGSAAIRWEGSVRNGRAAEILKKKGNRWTSSFEAEVSALSLAVGAIKRNRSGSGRALICSDSRSALQALCRPNVDARPHVQLLKNALDDLDSEVTLLWVPAHCGIKGNEVADSKAKSATKLHPGETVAESVSMDASLALLKARVLRYPINHPRLAKIYNPASSSPFSSNSFPLLQPSSSTLKSIPSANRREEAMLSQLRTGHCSLLAAYGSVVNPESSSLCPFCRENNQDVEHWLRYCPAHINLRQSIFGVHDPALEALLKDPEKVLAYARRTILARA